MIMRCPFCAGNNNEMIKTSGSAVLEGVGFYVYCNDCDAGGPIRPTEKDAVCSWNTVSVAVSARVTKQGYMSDLYDVLERHPCLALGEILEGHWRKRWTDWRNKRSKS